MEDNMHLVNFDMYCPGCKHFTKSENEEPCESCLTVPARKDSHKPERWEENDG